MVFFHSVNVVDCQNKRSFGGSDAELQQQAQTVVDEMSNWCKISRLVINKNKTSNKNL